MMDYSFKMQHLGGGLVRVGDRLVGSIHPVRPSNILGVELDDTLIGYWVECVSVDGTKIKSGVSVLDNRRTCSEMMATFQMFSM